MPLKKRILRVRLQMPNGEKIIDQELFLRIQIQKAALALQNRCVIDIGGLSSVLREELLSQFTAWKRRKVVAGELDPDYLNVSIEAGYEENGVDNSTLVFRGQVVQCDLVSVPPDIVVRLECSTQQIDKRPFASDRAPAQTTFANYVKWAAQQMGFGDDNYRCETSFNERIINNPGRSISTVGALLIDIQSYDTPNVVAFVDDDVLIVKDRTKVINPSDIAQVTEFIGVPSWQEYGVEFATLFDSNIRLAQAVELHSKMNTSVNGQYVLTTLTYDLASRDTPFYVKAYGSPPA